MAHSGTITELWRFPVKSMAGERVGALQVDWRGAAGDRTHAVRFSHKGADRPLTARQAPGLLRWRASYPDVREAATEAPPIAALTAPGGEWFAWDDPQLPAVLEADLGRSISLRRDLDGQQDLGRTLLLTTRASLEALEAELRAPVDPRRFRTNLHLDLDAPAWAELAGWEGGHAELEGGVTLRLLHPCERCVIPTRHPDTIERWPGLLKHLHAIHDTAFGINARVETPGRVAEGAAVTIHPPRDS